MINNQNWIGTKKDFRILFIFVVHNRVLYYHGFYFCIIIILKISVLSVKKRKLKQFQHILNNQLVTGDTWWDTYAKAYIKLLI